MIVYYVSGFFSVLFARMADGARARGKSGDPSRARAAETSAKMWAVLCGLVLITVGALRWRVGTDYGNYARGYRSWVEIPLAERGLLGEPGLGVIAKVGAIFYDDYAIMLGLASVITTWLFVRTIYRTSDMFAFSIALFILAGPWLGSFNGVRQYLACAIIFAGHKFILERKTLKYAGLVFLASLFHVSAFVALLFYFVPRRRPTVISGAIVIVAALVISESYGQILEVAMTFRPESDFSTGYVTRTIDPLRIAVAFAPIVLYLFVSEKKNFKSEDFFYVQMLLINAATFLAASGSAYIARFAIYTLAFVVVAIPRLIPLDTSRAFRFTLIAVVTLLYAAYWYVETSATSDLANFRWVFFRDPNM